MTNPIMQQPQTKMAAAVAMSLGRPESVAMMLPKSNIAKPSVETAITAPTRIIRSSIWNVRAMFVKPPNDCVNRIAASQLSISRPAVRQLRFNALFADISFRTTR
jgi:hypothetical protein